MATKIISRANQLTYHALQKAIENNKLKVLLDYGKINRPQSPIYNPWENLLPVLVPVLIGVILIIFVSVIFGLLFIIGMTLVYAHILKKKLYKRIIERTNKYIITSYENCDELWNFGGLIFINNDNKEIGCVSPAGDWKDFIINNFSDLMIDKVENSETKEEVADNEKAS